MAAWPEHDPDTAGGCTKVGSSPVKKMRTFLKN